MSQIEEDKVREERITTEVIVDAEDSEEKAMGWYYYLDDNMNVPFNAKWTKKGGKSATPKPKEVEVVGMAPEDECLRGMVVEVIEKGGKEEDVFSAKLADIEPIDADEETLEAIQDWHYWVNRGYKL